MGRFSPTSAAGIMLSVLLLFCAGFVLLHGRVAHESGSWRYTITHDDEYAFWVIADGFARSPRSDANPFYAEHAGETHSILSYPLVAAIGALSGWLDVSVLTFLPLWKIGAPFVAWLLMWGCLVRIWGLHRAPAAAIVLCVLAGTLLLHGFAQHTLLRFTRPIDAIGPAAIWLSFAFHPQALRGRQTLLAGFAVVLALLLSPFIAVFCAVSTWAAWLWARLFRQPGARAVLGLAGVATMSGLLLLMRVVGDAEGNRWLSASLAFDGVPGTGMSLLLFCLAVGAVFVRQRRAGLLRSDAVLLCILAVEPCAALVEPILGHGFAVTLHRYYYLVFEILAIIAWLCDAVGRLEIGDRRRPWEVPAAVLAGLGIGIMVAWPSTNFVRLLPRHLPVNAEYDNSLLLLQLIPVLALVVWVLRRGCRLHRGAGWLLTGAFVCACFASWPQQLTAANRAMPFAAAHRWLSEHARPGEVLMTLPPDYGLYDYAPLYAPVTVYYNPFASRLVAEPYENEYRKSVYFGLYCGILDRPDMPIPAPMSERLREFRLDYVLAWKGPRNDRWRRQTAPQLPELTGQVHDSVRCQLGPFLHTEYEDDECVLWRLQH